MILKELINYIKNVSLAYPTVQEFGEGDIYEFLNSGEHRYPTVFLTIESITSDEDAQTLNASIFYVDRLLSNSSNKIDIQTVGLTALKSIKEKLEEENYINFTSINYTPFTEKFSDLCAGVFAQCNIQVNDTLECDDYELGTLTITENGLYNILGYSQVLIDVKGGGEGGSKDPNSIGAYDGMSKINDYLYSISYSNIDYADAIKHFASITDENSGACSFIRMGDKIGRNFDWTINNQVEFLVKTPNTGKHYSVTGIATVAGITTNNIDEYSEDFKYLPFRLVDGINERGLVCSVNQLPQSDKTISKNGTTPTDELKETVSMFMLIRYILDNFDSALEAADYIKKYVKVMPILDKSGNALDFHYCIADKDKTVYLYFDGTETKYEEKANDKFVMTNFRLAGTSLVDGHYSVTDSNIEEFGQGIERANSLIDNFDLDEVVFTKAYTTTDRLTDFAGIEGATISNTEKLAEIQARAAAKFDQEQAAGSLRTSADLWQTVHSVEYDLNNLSIIIKNQEIEDYSESEFKSYVIQTSDIEVVSTEKGNLEISDEDGNVIARFKDGDVQTKNFNSSTLSKRPYQRRTVFQYLVDCDSPIKTDLWTIKDLNTTPVQKKEYMDRAVLYLPETYTPDGSPTKIILYCKPGASEITPSSDPILGYTDAPVMHYLIHKGYAVLSADGIPDEYAAEINICERVVGNYIAVQSIRKAYDYVAEHYNIDTNGAYVYGYSQGGHFAQNIVDLSGIKIIAAAEVSPVCSMKFHQWDLSASGNIGGVQWTKLARLNIARLFDFPSVSTNAELLALSFDQNKVQGYDPWTRNVVNLYSGFVQGSTYGSNLWKLPSGTTLDSITMRKQTGCPLKIWCAENDNALGVDVMKVFVKAIKNAGCVADLTIYSTGAHKIQSNQASIGKFVDDGEICDLIPLAYEVEAWYNKFGGEKIK